MCAPSINLTALTDPAWIDADRRVVPPPKRGTDIADLEACPRAPASLDQGPNRWGIRQNFS